MQLRHMRLSLAATMFQDWERVILLCLVTDDEGSAAASRFEEPLPPARLARAASSTLIKGSPRNPGEGGRPAESRNRRNYKGRVRGRRLRRRFAAHR